MQTRWNSIVVIEQIVDSKAFAILILTARACLHSLLTFDPYSLFKLQIFKIIYITILLQVLEPFTVLQLIHCISDHKN